MFFLASNIYGASFGTFPYQIEKQSSDLELEYRIGFINPSSSPVQVELSATDSEEYNVTFSKNNFRIPSGTTRNPSGSGWYHLGNGSYTRIHEVSFNVDVSRYREDNSLSFPIRIESAAIQGNASGEGSNSRLVQVRNYRYRAEIDPSLRPEDQPDNSKTSWRDNFWQEENSNSEEDFNLEQNKSSNQEQQDDNSQKGSETSVNRSSQPESNSGNSLVNKTTLILIVGIIVSLGYILMEV